MKDLLFGFTGRINRAKFWLAHLAVFVVVAVVSLLVEGVTVVCLWHPDTRAYVRGPWVGGPGADEGSAGAGRPTDGPAAHSA